MRINFDNKLNDIQKVIKLIPTQFIPPPEICYNILLNLLFLLKIKNFTSKKSNNNNSNLNDDINRLILFFRVLMISSLSQLEYEKNILSTIYNKRKIVIVTNLFKICFKIITTTKINQDDSQLIADCMNYFIGNNHNYSNNNKC